MYQHTGRQRGVEGNSGSRRLRLNRSDVYLPGVEWAVGLSLITRRSQVQILPPPPTNTRSEAFPSRSSVRASRHFRAAVQHELLYSVRSRAASEVAIDENPRVLTPDLRLLEGAATSASSRSHQKQRPSGREPERMERDLWSRGREFWCGRSRRSWRPDASRAISLLRGFVSRHLVSRGRFGQSFQSSPVSCLESSQRRSMVAFS